MQTLRNKKGFICDMDGVIYHGNRLLPGVREFVDWLQREKKDFLFLTNNSGKTQRELQAKLSRMGLDIDEKHFYTSALATAQFIATQMPGARAFVIGEPGLLNALYEQGITFDKAKYENDYIAYQKKWGSPAAIPMTISAGRCGAFKKAPGSLAPTAT